MTFKLFDRYALDDAAKINYTRDGFMTAMPRVARTGIQLYRGSEVGVSDKAVVRIYRDEAEVFSTDSLQSFAHKPVTNDHPPEAVTADNWKRYATGQLGDEIARDGQFIRVPMVLMDGGAINKFRDGKQELSVGYTCDIEMIAGTTADGEEYDGIQKNIRVNHVAQVDAARGGAELRIGDGTGEARLAFKDYAVAFAAAQKGAVNTADVLIDANGFLAKDKKYPILKDGVLYVAALRAAATDSIAKGDGDVISAAQSLLSLLDAQVPTPMADSQKGPHMAKYTVDGVTVEMDEMSIQVVDRAIKSMTTALSDAKSALTKATTDAAAVATTKDAEIAKLSTDLATAATKVTTLESQVKDSEITPAKLDALVADRKVVADKAKVLLPAVVVDGKSDSEIRRQVVTAKVGDKSKDWNDEMVKISFDTLAESVKLDTATTGSHRPGGVQDSARVLSSGGSQSGLSDAHQALSDRNAAMSERWKGAAKH